MECAGYAFVVCYHQAERLRTSFMMRNKNVGFGDKDYLTAVYTYKYILL